MSLTDGNGMNEHLAVDAMQKATPKGQPGITGFSPISPGAHLLLTPCPHSTCWRPCEAAYPMPGSYLLKEITLIKGIKIASNDGKQFVERDLLTRGETEL
jgi:hypothetical protein